MPTTARDETEVAARLRRLPTPRFPGGSRTHAEANGETRACSEHFREMVPLHPQEIFTFPTGTEKQPGILSGVTCYTESPTSAPSCPTKRILGGLSLVPTLPARLRALVTYRSHVPVGFRFLWKRGVKRAIAISHSRLKSSAYSPGNESPVFHAGEGFLLPDLRVLPPTRFGDFLNSPGHRTSASDCRS